MTGDRRIDVMIAGAQKAGTTSLAATLEQIDGVVTHHGLEYGRFVQSALRGEPFPRQQAIPSLGDTCFLAKSVGLMYVSGAAERLLAHSPPCHVIVTLRDPVDRAYSAYWYLKKVGLETARTFEEALALEEDRLRADYAAHHHFAYVGRGLYADQVQRLIGLFRDRLHVVFFEELVRAPDAEIDRLVRSIPPLDALGVSAPPKLVHENAAGASRFPSMVRVLTQPSPFKEKLTRFVPPATRSATRSAVRRVLSRKPTAVPPMAEDTRLRLESAFADANLDLAAVLGTGVVPWSDPQ